MELSEQFLSEYIWLLVILSFYFMVLVLGISQNGVVNQTNYIMMKFYVARELMKK